MDSLQRFLLFSKTGLQGLVNMLLLLGRTPFLFHLIDSSQLHRPYANNNVENLLKLYPPPSTTHMINLHFEPTLNTE